jgi:hypothetical protein
MPAVIPFALGAITTTITGYAAAGALVPIVSATVIVRLSVEGVRAGVIQPARVATAGKSS